MAGAHFKARGCGQLLNVSSELGRVPAVLPRCAYSAAKHFLNALTANFRDELAQTHPAIVVTLVSPGLVFTEFGVRAVHGGVDSRALRGVRPGQEADDVARVLLNAIRARATDVYTAKGAKHHVLAYLAKLVQEPDTIACE